MKNSNKKPPIVIAGNGPSLRKIDYSRLPQNFDVFRCNQFYFEDRYFLGKEIKGVFFNPQVFKEQYFTLHHLEERGEYKVEDVYCNWAFKDAILDRTSQFVEFHNNFPCVKNTYVYLEALPQFLKKDRFFRVFYRRWPTSGIVMLITAIAQGYKEIYLTGIDFYEGGGVDYAFEMKDKKIQKLLSFNPNAVKSVHSQELDQAFIELALKDESLCLYSLSPDTTLCKNLPLAPIQNKFSCEVLSKPEGYIADLVDLPKNIQSPSDGWIEKIKKALIRGNLDRGIKKNIFFILIRDFLFCLKVLVFLIKKAFKVFF